MPSMSPMSSISPSSKSLTWSWPRLSILCLLIVCQADIFATPLSASPRSKANPAGLRRKPAATATTAASVGGSTLAIQPAWELAVKDSRSLQQLIQRNPWFQEFRSTELYRTVISSLAPALFSIADDFGPSAHTWKGRLLDYVYDMVLQGKPIVFDDYNRDDWNSPFAVSVYNLSGTEIKVLQGLVRVFRDGQDHVERLSGLEATITPLAIHDQKFALNLRDSCFSIARDAKPLIAQGSGCEKAKAISQDARLKVRLTKEFPALEEIRKLYLTDDTLDIAFHWNSEQFRFEPLSGNIGIKPETVPLVTSKINDHVLSSLPPDTFFYGFAMLPTLEDLAKLSRGSLLPKGASNPNRIPPVPAVLFTSPYTNHSTVAKVRIGSGLILLPKEANAKAVDKLTLLLRQHGASQVLVRLCRDAILLTPDLNVLNATWGFCQVKSSSHSAAKGSLSGPASSPGHGPSYGPDLFVGHNLMGGIYFAPGKMLAALLKFDAFSSPRAAAAEASDSATGQHLLEALPQYSFSAQLEASRITLKPE